MATDYLLQEGGAPPGKITLEDGTGFLILESSTAAGVTYPQLERFGSRGIERGILTGVR